VNIGGESTGLITYMRTDGVYVSGEAIEAARRLASQRYGQSYIPEKPRAYSTKAKNAQEAHEAIRPTDISRTPESVEKLLDSDQYKLYSLIWKRMVASQMASAVLDQLSVDIASSDKKHSFRATGSRVSFPGFYALYREGLDDEKEDSDEQILPAVAPDEVMRLEQVEPLQHFTEPPPRYSEASLVKRLEELGIGRPSTYASIISVLQDRNYVTLDKKRFVPEPRGRIVTSFLELYFAQYVQYDFTARLEDSLDDVSAGEMEWKQLLRQFWVHFIETIEKAREEKPSAIIGQIEHALRDYLFPPREGVAQHDSSCPSCKTGTLSLKAGKFGAFLGCSAYPECRYTRQLEGEAGDSNGAEGNHDEGSNGLPRSLGQHPANGFGVTLKKGPYGVYVELEDGEKKPKRASLPKGFSAESLTLEQAVGLLSLPREVGMHPESGKPIRAGIGRFGPYVEHDGQFASLTAEDDVLTVGMNRAVSLLAEKQQRKAGGIEVLRQIGEHPEGGPIELCKGRYGPYIRHGKLNASLGRDVDGEGLTLNDAIELLKKQAEKAPSAKKPFKKASTAKKPAAASKKKAAS
jgi:DNA topoisomerase-1